MSKITVEEVGNYPFRKTFIIKDGDEIHSMSVSDLMLNFENDMTVEYTEYIEVKVREYHEPDDCSRSDYHYHLVKKMKGIGEPKFLTPKEVALKLYKSRNYK